MGLRDVLERISGKRSGSAYDRRSGRVRRRSEATMELSAAGIDEHSEDHRYRQARDPRARQADAPAPAADRDLYTDPGSAADPDSARPLQQVPGSRPPRRPDDAPPPPVAPAPSDAATQYLHIPILERSDVAAVLVAIDGDMKGEVFKLFEGDNQLGRSESNDVVLASKWISRQHAKVIHRDGVFALMPLSERNRTYLNDVAVGDCEMTDGDLLRVGHTTFRFRTIEGL